MLDGQAMLTSAWSVLHCTILFLFAKIERCGIHIQMLGT
uniref:Uncharacterized protein n=1 Tax=Arundo donax TaxID=35708 RepID=A0A0A9SQ52_ARUDO